MLKSGTDFKDFSFSEIKFLESKNEEEEEKQDPQKTKFIIKNKFQVNVLLEEVNETRFG